MLSSDTLQPHALQLHPLMRGALLQSKQGQQVQWQVSCPLDAGLYNVTPVLVDLDTVNSTGDPCVTALSSVTLTHAPRMYPATAAPRQLQAKMCSCAGPVVVAVPTSAMQQLVVQSAKPTAGPKSGGTTIYFRVGFRLCQLQSGCKRLFLHSSPLPGQPLHPVTQLQC